LSGCLTRGRRGDRRLLLSHREKARRTEEEEESGQEEQKLEARKRKEIDSLTLMKELEEDLGRREIKTRLPFGISPDPELEKY
jgi:hypothetical protein